MKSKKSVSLMVSYVILISIIIGVSIGVYAWLKTMASSPETINCKDGTSVILEQYNCQLGNVKLTLKNNGRFNVNGIILAVSESLQKAPTTYLIPQIGGGILEGHYQFENPLKPGQTKTADFTNKIYNPVTKAEEEVSFTNILVIQIQPFIIRDNKRINCQDSIITQEVSGCQIKL